MNHVCTPVLLLPEDTQIVKLRDLHVAPALEIMAHAEHA